MSLVEVRNLRVVLPTARGPVEALRGIDLVLERGDSVGLIGESGCGKTLTALALMGLLPDGAQVEGSLRFDGHELLGLPDAAWCALRGRRIGMVFQEPMTALNPLHTVGDQVGESLRQHRGLSRREARAEALHLLEQVRLPQAARRLDAYPHQLSGGQRQRVGIAAAIACGPDLLIADEPTTALDATLRGEILDLLSERVATGRMALLLVSHDLALMAQRVARVCVMYGGSVVEHGPTRQVFERLAHPYTRGLHDARPQLGVQRGSQLPTIPGRVPALAELPRGCPFQQRCARRVDACVEMPPRYTIGPGHAVRCFNMEPAA